MKSRWLLNLLLLAVVAGLAVFLYLRPKQETAAVEVKVSSIDPGTISRVSIEFPARKPVVLEKRDGRWFLQQPYSARADQSVVGRILGVLEAPSVDKLDAADPARYGLDQPALKLKLDGHEILFGTFNPVNGQQYIAYGNAVYLVSTAFADAAGTQVAEMLDKRLLGPDEQVAGFDFSRLEQWEEVGGLKLEREGGKWKVSNPQAKPVQKELDEWFRDSWGMLVAKSVEPYKPDARSEFPSFEILLKDGKRIHVNKELESPELILARPDEGLRYHIQPDVGFQLLNPPVGIPK